MLWHLKSRMGPLLRIDCPCQGKNRYPPPEPSPGTTTILLLTTFTFPYSPPGIFPYPPPGYPREPPPYILQAIHFPGFHLYNVQNPLSEPIKRLIFAILSVYKYVIQYIFESLRKRKGAITHHQFGGCQHHAVLSSFAAHASPQNRLKRGKDQDASLQTVCRISPDKMQQNYQFPAFWYIDFQICICYNAIRQKREYVHEDKKE